MHEQDSIKKRFNFQSRNYLQNVGLSESFTPRPGKNREQSRRGSNPSVDFLLSGPPPFTMCANPSARRAATNPSDEQMPKSDCRRYEACPFPFWLAYYLINSRGELLFATNEVISRLFPHGRYLVKRPGPATGTSLETAELVGRSGIPSPSRIGFNRKTNVPPTGR